MQEIEQLLRRHERTPEGDRVYLSVREETEKDTGLYVMKFGGTSMGSAGNIDAVSNIILNHRREGKKIVVVVSAMSGVTNMLVELADLVSKGTKEGKMAEIRNKHNTAVQELNITPGTRRALRIELDTIYRKFAQDVGDVNMGEDERRDRILSYGERLSSRILAYQLMDKGFKSQPVDSTGIVVTDENFGEATPDYEKTKEKTQAFIMALLYGNITPVVTGFLGATVGGRFTTLGRNASDYSATFLGRMLGAKEIWIWTDVDGVYDKDPNIYQDAKMFDEMSVEHARKIGGKVLHERTFEPLIGTEIGVRVKNSFKPSSGGTLIVDKVKEVK